MRPIIPTWVPTGVILAITGTTVAGTGLVTRNTAILVSGQGPSALALVSPGRITNTIAMTVDLAAGGHADNR
jgi:hypothetical protein